MPCAANAALAAVVTSDDFVVAALCLHTQLQRLGSQCPLLLLFDDRSGRLSEASMERLRSTFGREQLQPLSALAAAHYSFPPETTKRKRQPAPSCVRSPITHGRRLFSDIRRTHEKVFIWALPYERVLYIDLDTLVLQSLDDLLTRRGDFLTGGDLLTGRSKLAATPCGSKFFITGVMLIRPDACAVAPLLAVSRFALPPWLGRVPLSLRRAADDPTYWPNKCQPVTVSEETMRVCVSTHNARRSEREQSNRTSHACRPSPAFRQFPNERDPVHACMSHYGGHWRTSAVIERACSAKLGDQAIHNFHFRKQWTPLPEALGINVDARKWDGKSAARLLHFFGEPKPWSPKANARLPAVRLYRNVCRAVFCLYCDEGWPLLP